MQKEWGGNWRNCEKADTYIPYKAERPFAVENPVRNIRKIGEAYPLKSKPRHTLQRNAKQQRTCPAVPLTYKSSAVLPSQAAVPTWHNTELIVVSRIQNSSVRKKYNKMLEKKQLQNTAKYAQAGTFPLIIFFKKSLGYMPVLREWRPRNAIKKRPA